MPDDLKIGDKVTWQSHGGTAHGKVRKKQTSPTKIEGHDVAATRANPQFFVETADGKAASHKPDALRKDS